MAASPPSRSPVGARDEVRTLQITLPDALRVFLDEQVARGGHSDASAYLAKLLQEVRLREAKHELDAKLLEGVRSIASPLTENDWAEIRREGLARLAEPERR